MAGSGTFLLFASDVPNGGFCQSPTFGVLPEMHSITAEAGPVAERPVPTAKGLNPLVGLQAATEARLVAATGGKRTVAGSHDRGPLGLEADSCRTDQAGK